MGNYRYILDKSSKKFICPSCNKKRYVKYVDAETNLYLPDYYGCCDRLVNCGYSLNPYKDGYHKEDKAQKGTIWHKPVKRILKAIKPFYPIPENVVLNTLKDYSSNNLINYLKTIFEHDVIIKTIELYCLGTVCNFTSFPFISIDGVCNAISLIKYNNIGKRINDDNQSRNIHTYLLYQYKSQNKPIPEWLSKYLTNESKFNCLFGEHIVKLFPDKPIGLVEAPKTAFIASLIYPEYIWLAVGALSYLTKERMVSILGKDVYVFPDTSTGSIAYNLWQKKSKEYNFICVDLLENLASNKQKEDGYDLADFILENKTDEIRPNQNETIQNMDKNSTERLTHEQERIECNEYLKELIESFRKKTIQNYT